MAKLMIWMVVVVANLLVGHSRADFLNEYLNDKTFGAVPGPCPTANDKCVTKFEDLSQQVKDITVCLLSDNAGCSRIGDLLKAGTFEVWELQCKDIVINGIQMTRRQTLSDFIWQDVTVNKFQLGCNFMLNMKNVVLSIGSRASAKATITDAFISFPYSGYAGSVDANLAIELMWNSIVGELVNNAVPNRVELPADKCEVGLDMGIDLKLQDLDYLELCYDIPCNFFTRLFCGETCANVVDKQNGNGALINWLIGAFNIDGILSALIRILEAVLGGIVCQVIEEMAVLTSPQGVVSDGVLNVELQHFKQILDDWGNSPALDPADYDDPSYISNNLDYVSAVQLQNATDLSDNTVAEILSVSINNWLGVNSRTPGYEDKLVINELIDLLTEIDGYVQVDLIARDLAPEVTLPLNVVDLTTRLNFVALDGLNTIQTLQLLQNSYDQNDPSQRFRYTFMNNFVISRMAFEVEIYTKLAPGDWVTRGTRTSEFTFTYSMELVNLALNAATMSLINIREIEQMQLGQITSLDFSDTSKLTDTLKQLVYCVGPAVYAFNITDLEASLGQIGDVKMKNFDGSGLSELIEDAVELGGDVLKGALRTKLPGIARGPARELINQVIYENVIEPTGTCPAWTGPKGRGPHYVRFSQTILGDISDLIDSSVGGDPILDTGADINELVKTVVSYFGSTYEKFPLEQNPSDDGLFELKDLYKDFLVLESYGLQSVNKMQITNFFVENLDSIYKLRALPLADNQNGVEIQLGVGGELAPIQQGVTTPLRLGFTFDVAAPNVQNTAETFNMVLQLSKIQANFALTALATLPDFIDGLRIGDLTKVRCLIGAVHDIQFVDALRTLSVDDIKFFLSGRVSNNVNNDLNRALTSIGLESVSGLPQTNGRVIKLINSAVKGTMNLVLDTIESIPTEYGRGKVTYDNCSLAEDPLDLANSASSLIPDNLGSTVFEDCLEPVDFNNLPETVEDLEDKVVINEEQGDIQIDLRENPLVAIAKDLLDDVFQNGMMDAFLVRIANSTGSILADLFELDPENPNLVDAVIPLSLLGLKLENDVILKGLILDAGKIRIRRVNKLLTAFNVLEVLGAYTTRNRIEFTSGNAINVTIESYMQVDGSTVGESAPVKEEVDINFEMSRFTIDFELLTALNPTALAERALGHFLRVDSNYGFHLADHALDCLLTVFYENGLYMRKLNIDVGVIDKVSVKSRSNELLSESFEDLFRAVTKLLIDFYKNAVTPICHNCVRKVANDFFQSARAISQCPAVEDFEAPPFASPDDHIFKFNESPDLKFFQETWDEYFRSDNFNSMNAVLRTIFDGALYFNELKQENFEFYGLPVVYYGTSYGTIDIGLANVRLTGLGFDELLLAKPYYNDQQRRQLEPVPAEQLGAVKPYTTYSDIGIPGPVSLQFDLMFNANDFFADQPVSENKIRFNITLEDLDVALQLMIKLNITQALNLEIGAISTLEKLPCLIIPLKKLDILDSAFSLKSVTFSAECLIENCGFPMLDTNGFKLETTNGPQVGQALTDFMEFTARQLDEIGVDQLIDAGLAISELSCTSLLDYIESILNKEPPENPDIGMSIGIAMAGLVGSLAMGAVAMVPMHQKKRKQALIQQLDAHQSVGTRTSMEVLILSTKSFFALPSTPLVVKFGLPFLSLVNLALLVMVYISWSLTDVITVATIFGASTNALAVIPSTMPLLLQVIWYDIHPILSILLWVTNTFIPMMHNIALLFCWFLPATLISLKKRRSIIQLVESTGKLTFVMFLLNITMLAGLYTKFGVSDYNELSFVSAGALALEVNVRGGPGLYALLVVAISTILMAHYQSHIGKKLADMEEGIDHQKMSLQKVSLSEYKFRANRTLSVSPRAMKFLSGATIFAMLLVIVGTFVPVFVIEAKGVLGKILEEVSDGSPTIEEPMNLKKYSIAELGLLMGDSPTPNGGYRFGVIFSQVLFAFLFFFAPLAQLAVMLYGINAKVSISAMEKYIRFHKKLFYWQALDLIVGSIIIAYFVLGEITRVFLNWASGSVIQDLCFTIEPALTLALDEENGSCADAEVIFLPGLIIPILAVIVQMNVTLVYWQLADVVFQDRKYGSLASKPNLMVRTIVRNVTVSSASRDPSESDADARVSKWVNKFGTVEPIADRNSKLANNPLYNGLDSMKRSARVDSMLDDDVEV